MRLRSRCAAQQIIIMSKKLDSLPAADVHRPPTKGWKPWVYLASGMGFSARERALVLPELVAALEAAGAAVFEPFTDNAEGAKTAAEQPSGWAYRIGQADLEAVRRCDAVFCVANGNPPVRMPPAHNPCTRVLPEVC
jgi:hypothetical protein